MYALNCYTALQSFRGAFPLKSLLPSTLQEGDGISEHLSAPGNAKVRPWTTEPREPDKTTLKPQLLLLAVIPDRHFHGASFHHLKR